VADFSKRITERALSFFKPVIWLYRKLFRRKKKIDRNKTTKNFQSFEHYKKRDNELMGSYQSPETIMATYIAPTKSSPFLGDDDMEEARKFLIEEDFKKKNYIREAHCPSFFTKVWYNKKQKV